jgi:hypothetical protein
MRDDMRIFYQYASNMIEGQIPYRDFVVEYPIAAIPFFLMPRLFGEGLPRYWVAFGVEVLLVNALVVFLVAWWVNRREGTRAVGGRLEWYTAYFLVLCPLALTRFDIVPTAAAFGSACLWYSGREGAGGLLAGLGTLVKIFPGVLAAPGLVWDWPRSPKKLSRVSRGGLASGAATPAEQDVGTATPKDAGRRISQSSLVRPAPRSFKRGLLALGATVTAGSAVWFAVGGVGVVQSLQYHTERGLEIGSLYSGLLMAVAAARGTPLATSYTHFSMELVAEGAGSLAKLAFPLQALGLLVVAGRFWLADRTEPMRFATAAVLAFVIFGKVLSPQYMLWLIPFVATLEGELGRLARLAFVLACVATTLIYPWEMHRLLSFHPVAILALNGRNGLLLAIWLLLVAGPAFQAKNGPEVVP